MPVACVEEMKRFAAEKFQKVNLFDTERMFCDIYCFEPGQEQTAHAHAENDKVYFVLEGCGAFTVGDETIDGKPGTAIHCPPAIDHGVLNTGHGRLVVLVFMAPHP
ncbi:MAG: cupin domain-containing protein [Gemmatimonadota bacterium]|nr:cupin domain-containing protein [Gemmatimonadota bacterium]